LQNGYHVKSVDSLSDNSFPTLFGTSSGFMSIFKQGFFSKDFKRKQSHDTLIDLIKNDEYLLARVIAVATTLDIYEQLYGKTRIDFAISLDELKQILNQHFPGHEILIRRPEIIRDLVFSRLKV
jgi:hypothetical protein